MKIVVAGGTGFIGGPLVAHLAARGEDVAVLTRNPRKVKAGRGLQWNPNAQGPWSTEVASADVVINLAGENIGEGRWTAQRKERLVSSRIEPTKALVAAMRSEAGRERTFISASAVGFYGDRADADLDETSAPGTGFLAELCRKWEGAALQAEPLARVVILRFGVVFAADGGALAKMARPFHFGAGGRIGSGDQWISWVHRDDVIHMVEWLIDTSAHRGVYNVCAPTPVRNGELTRQIGRVLHRPALFAVPGFALRLALGEMASEMLLSGQRVLPRHAVSEGFRFEYPQVEGALRHSL